MRPRSGAIGMVFDVLSLFLVLRNAYKYLIADAKILKVSQHPSPLKRVLS